MGLLLRKKFTLHFYLTVVGIEMFFSAMASRYVKCMEDMGGRAAGSTTKRSVAMLKPSQPNGFIIPFDSNGGRSS